MLSWLRQKLLDMPRKHFILVLAVIIGFLSGMVAVILKNLVYFIQFLLTLGFVKDYFNILYVAYPLIGIFLTVFIMKRVIKKEPGHGIPSVLYAISRRKSTLKRHTMFSALLTSFVTVGFGGSAGLEAPTVQTTASMGSTLASQLKLNYKARTLLIGCAAAASLAAIFKAPVAAIVFAVEVIMIDLTTTSLVPLLLASISALLTSSFFLGEDVLLHYSLRDPYHFGETHFYILLGILTGVFSVYFNKIYQFINRILKKIKRPFRRAIFGGFMLGIIIFIFPPLYGEGYEVINALLADDLRKVTENSIFYDHTGSVYMMLLFMASLLFFKVVATAFTLGSGGVGGIFAPTLFMGSTLGFLFTRIFRYFEIKDLSASNFTLVGMAGLMAGVMHAPLTAIFLIAELTGGYELFVPLMLTAAISYYTAKLITPYTLYTGELAKRGELITHNKDQAVLTLMNLKDEIQTDFKTVGADWTLGQLVDTVSQSGKNAYPVIDPEGNLMGVVTLDDIRQVMFDQSQYDEMHVYMLMSAPREIIHTNDSMAEVMKKFDESEAWDLPVVEGHKYIGFVSKSRLFSAYRHLLKQFSQDEEE